MSEQSPRLALQNLVKSFDGRCVVDDVSLEVGAGQIVCLLGHSGCGKSTTLRIAAGVEQQNRGRVIQDGEVISDEHRHLPPEARAIGLMFQDFALFPHLNVGQNVAFGLAGGFRKNKAQVGALLERIGLAGDARKFPHELSGGEAQRVALARALAPKPRTILMDEPFSGLDNRLRDGIREETISLLKEEGTSVLLVTHDPEEAMRVGDSIALMRRGKIVQSGAPYNIYNTPVDREAASFFSDINVISGRVKGAQVDTPFGAFLAPGFADGTRIEIVIRPQHLKLDFDRQGKGPLPTEKDGVPARGTVARARFVGNQSLVDVAMDIDGTQLTATVPAVFLPQVGTPLWLSMRRDRCYVFEAA